MGEGFGEEGAVGGEEGLNDGFLREAHGSGCGGLVLGVLGGSGFVWLYVGWFEGASLWRRCFCSFRRLGGGGFGGVFPGEGSG